MKYGSKHLPEEGRNVVVLTATGFFVHRRRFENDMRLAQQLQRNHTSEELGDLADAAYEEYQRTPWWRYWRRCDIAARRRVLLMAKRNLDLNRFYATLPIWTGKPIPGCDYYRSPRTPK
ncbi:MAG: hypothetical protein WCT10_05210 [Patescibacteria group bacterium]|jgi:hypothetical protein